jgi:hypothetical protein
MQTQATHAEPTTLFNETELASRWKISCEFESLTLPKNGRRKDSELVKQSLLGRHTNFLQSFNSSSPIGKLLI